jgi:type II secretory pathway component GspD/PulD (secretin)
VGWLFKGDSNSDKMEEVLIFITPKILPTAVAAVNPAAGVAAETNKTRQQETGKSPAIQ